MKHIDALNRKYEAEVGKMNQHIVAEYTAGKGIVGAPAVVLADKSRVPDPLKAPAGAGCPKAFNDLVPRRQNPVQGAAWWADWAKYITSINGTVYTYVPAKGETEYYRCTHCHEEARGQSLFHKANFETVMAKYVVGGFMPPDADEYRKDSTVIKPNKADEELRAKVNQCFVQSYFGPAGALASWLKEPCANH
jgi:hypothetical protein